MSAWTPARLIGAVRRSSGRRARSESDLRALYASLRKVSAGTDIHAVLTTIAQHAADVFGAIDGLIMIRRGDDLRVYSGSRQKVDPIANAIGRRAFGVNRELPSVRVLRTGEPIAIPDATKYDGPPGFQEACRQAGVCSVLCVPIRTWHETTGSLNLGFGKPRHFSRRDVEVAEDYAEQAATALERARVLEIEQDARRALIELDELKFDFLSNVSNQLQTPLTAICGFSDLLLASGESLSPEQRHAYVERIAAQAKNLAGMVDDLLEARGNTPGIGAYEPLDLRLLAMSTVRAIEDELGARTVAIDVPEATVVWTHPSATDRVLHSLLTNAVQFSPDTSAITISARSQDGAVVVAVTDEGIGIGRDEQERIFDRFYRVHRTDSALRGTGLGLSVAKRYVEAMGGSMWVTSTPGKGSTFAFTLPLSDPTVDPTVEEYVQPLSTTGG